MTVDELAQLQDWKGYGNIGHCEVDGCSKPASDYAIIGQEAWFLCRQHMHDICIERRRIGADKGEK